MRIIFLGTCAAIPTKHRNHSSIGIKYEGEVFLFDCGEGTQRQMIYTDISPMKINNIFISHLHGDHILGLAGLLQSIGFNGRTEPINIYGPSETKNTIENILKIGYHSINFKINVYEINSKKPIKIIDSEKYMAYAYPVNHSVPCYAYILKEKKKPQLNLKKAIELGVEVGPDLKSLKDGNIVKLKNGKIIYPNDVLSPPKDSMCVAYSGDTTPLEDFGEFLNSMGCTLLIHEATFGSSKKNNAIETMHSTIEDAFNIGKIACVDTLILTHISARYDDNIEIYYNEIENLIKNNSNNDYNNNNYNNFKVIVAEDLMEYDLKNKKIIKK